MNKLKYILTLAIAAISIAACNSQKKVVRKKNAYMAAAYDTLKKAVPEAEVTYLKDTIKVLFPEHLLFKIGSAELNKDNYPLIDRFAKALNYYSKTKILINGYTDNTGSDEFNLKLSNDRATAAEQTLHLYQVDKVRTFKWGRGKSSPLASNDSEEGRRKNRRVEFIILYEYSGEQ